MTPQITIAQSPADLSGVADLMKTYLVWNLGEFHKAKGIALDTDAYLANSMEHLDQYMPPDGRFLLARDADEVPVAQHLVFMRLTLETGDQA